MKSYILSGLKKAFKSIWSWIDDTTSDDEYLPRLFRGLLRVFFVLIVVGIALVIVGLCWQYPVNSSITAGIAIILFEGLPRIGGH